MCWVVVAEGGVGQAHLCSSGLIRLVTHALWECKGLWAVTVPGLVWVVSKDVPGKGH